MRVLYEGYAEAMSRFLSMPLPPWLADRPHKDNWQTVARLRAQTEIAGASSPRDPANSGELPRAVSTIVERHHDF
jgi:hypothetical protein